MMLPTAQKICETYLNTDFLRHERQPSQLKMQVPQENSLQEDY
jgi:hypothetical protein